MAYIYEEVRLIYDKDSGAGEGIKFLKYKLPWFNYHPILDEPGILSFGGFGGPPLKELFSEDFIAALKKEGIKVEFISREEKALGVE